MEDVNKKLLKKVYKNAKTGSDSIEMVLDKVEDKNLTTELGKQKATYGDIALKAETALSTMGVTARDSGLLEKAQIWSGIQMGTATKGRDASHIAELMINGNTMGIIDMTRQIKKCESADQNALDMANNLVSIEQGHIETMKSFL